MSAATRTAAQMVCGKITCRFSAVMNTKWRTQRETILSSLFSLQWLFSSSVSSSAFVCCDAHTVFNARAWAHTRCAADICHLALWHGDRAYWQIIANSRLTFNPRTATWSHFISTNLSLQSPKPEVKTQLLPSQLDCRQNKFIRLDFLIQVLFNGQSFLCLLFFN